MGLNLSETVKWWVDVVQDVLSKWDVSLFISIGNEIPYEYASVIMVKSEDHV